MHTGKQTPLVAGKTDVRSLAALLSQILVAFTVEFDNQFEHRMREAGYPGALLSLVIWSNLVRFLTGADLSVHDLAVQALESEDQIKFKLGCLERWGFIVLRPDPDGDRPVAKRVHHRTGRLLRDGWGSGRGIRSAWQVRLTEKGRRAADIWSPLLDDIEGRCKSRFGGNQLDQLKDALSDVLEKIDLQLPRGFPFYWNAEYKYSKLEVQPTGEDHLPVLLSRLLLAFTIEFDCESRVPLRLCASILRVLGEEPIPLSEIPRLTGASPETTAIGWQGKPFVVVASDPTARRGKVAHLSPLGFKTQQTYRKLIHEIEQRWEARFGQGKIRRIRDCLIGLFVPRRGDRLLLSEGLVPAEGTVRFGTQAPALGRRDIGAAARQRMRDLAAQTEMFVRDPINGLPHYPLWDMNRGFGP